MARDILTGTRIRERRGACGLKQAELAQQAGISASYLNLIEHNRRRIGGKLLVTIARILDVEPTLLSEGAEARLIDALHRAAARSEGGRDVSGRAITGALGRDSEALPSIAEVEQVEEFASRFPGWSRLIANQAERIDTLSQTVDALTNRLAHDPQLASALHDILSTVTAIRSTAGILTEDPDITPEWRARFHRNINEEAARLSDSSTALVRYLEADQNERPVAPLEEVDAYLNARRYHFPELEPETGGAEGISAVLADFGEMQADVTRDLMQRYLSRAVRDFRRLPVAALSTAMADLGGDPAALAARLDVPLDTLLHRLAISEAGCDAYGFVVCDDGGRVLLRKSTPDLPLSGVSEATCLWPLFAALSRTGQPVRHQVEIAVDIPGRGGAETKRFEALAIALPIGPVRFDVPPRIEAVMLLRPWEAEMAAPETSALPLGL